jgi:hypothetical protein
MKAVLPALLVLAFATSVHASISLTGPSTAGAGWVSLGANYDFADDQQTGDPSSDIVGNAANPGFFTAFDDAGTPSLTDGFIAFRVRLDDRGGTSNNPKFDRTLWVGIDADLNGSVDSFIGVATPAQSTTIGIYDSGTGANTSPNTTTIAAATFTYATSATNYNYRPVNFLTDGGTFNDLTPTSTGDPDYYVSFKVSFTDLATFVTSQLPTTFNASNPFTQNTPIRYVLGTSTQANSINQDLGGINNKTANLSLSWTALGGFSPTISAAGAVPECSPTLLAFWGSLLVLGFKRRR